MDISRALNDFYQGLDNLYQTGRTDEIEAYVRRTMEENRGCCGGHGILFISCLNELGSYYRGISRYEESVRAFEEAGRDILGDMGPESVEYATNRCNLAGTARMMGDYNLALQLFTEAATIYNMIVGKDSYYYNTVLNNLALLYLDREEYEKAAGCLTEALDRIRRMPGKKEEEAITLVNLAVANQKLGRVSQAEEYLEIAMRIYERLEDKGAHYAAALNMQGAICMDKKDYEGAKAAFVKARDATFLYFGENDDYARAKENITFVQKAMNKGKSMKGLELSKRYFEEVGMPMIRRDFGPHESRIAAGLAGEGSEVLGFDDELSRDHDFGPSFCIWLTNEDYADFGWDLARAYEKLPGDYLGYPARKVFEGGEGRVGVLRISDFYRGYIGLNRAPNTIQEWLRIPEMMLAKATGGLVFIDGPGEFSKIRLALLDYYPPQVRLKKISVRAAVMAQSGQYNYPRCLKRGEPVAAACALTEFTCAVCSMVYLLNRRYMPFYKWAHHGLQFLTVLPEVHGKLEELHLSQDENRRISLVEEICTMVRSEWKKQGIADGSGDFLIDYSQKIIAGIEDPYIRSLHLMEE